MILSTKNFISRQEESQQKIAGKMKGGVGRLFKKVEQNSTEKIF